MELSSLHKLEKKAVAYDKGIGSASSEGQRCSKQLSGKACSHLCAAAAEKANAILVTFQPKGGSRSRLAFEETADLYKLWSRMPEERKQAFLQ